MSRTVIAHVQTYLLEIVGVGAVWAAYFLAHGVSGKWATLCTAIVGLGVALSKHGGTPTPPPGPVPPATAAAPKPPATG